MGVFTRSATRPRRIPLLFCCRGSCGGMCATRTRLVAYFRDEEKTTKGTLPLAQERYSHNNETKVQLLDTSRQDLHIDLDDGYISAVDKVPFVANVVLDSPHMRKWR